MPIKLFTKMKLIIIVGLLTVISMAASAQVYRFNAYQASSITDFNKLIGERDWTNTDMSVEMNFDRDQINILGNNGRNWYLRNKLDSFVNVGQNEYVLHYEAVDANGVSCQVYVTFFNDSTDEKAATLTMIYSNYKLSFRLRKEAN
jgi:hypothetical protein